MRRRLRLVGPPRRPSSTTGLDTRLASVLCYLGFFFSGLIFYLIEKEDYIVRFHALQSVMTFILLSVFGLALNVFSVLPFIGTLFRTVLTVLLPFTIVIWLFLMYKASSGHIYRLPFIGDAVDRNLPF